MCSVKFMFLSVVCLTVWLIMASVLGVCMDLQGRCQRVMSVSQMQGLVPKSQNMAALSFKCIISSVMTSY